MCETAIILLFCSVFELVRHCFNYDQNLCFREMVMGILTEFIVFYSFLIMLPVPT